MNKGSVAEILVIKELNNRGFFVRWLSLTGNDPFDILALKDNKKIKIEVKSAPNDKMVDYIAKKRAHKGADFIIIVKNVQVQKIDGYRFCEGFWVVPTFKKLHLEVDRYKEGFIQLEQFIKAV